MLQGRGRAGALGHGSKQCTHARACMARGTSPHVPGLPGPARQWRDSTAASGGSPCARMYTALQGGQVGRDSNQHQIKHEPTPKSMLRGGKGHAFLRSRGGSCAAHPQAAPGARMLPICFEVCLGQVGTYRPCSMGLLCFPGQKLLHRSSSNIFPKFKRKAQSVSSRRAWAPLRTQTQVPF